MVSHVQLDDASHSFERSGPAIALCTLGRLELADDATLSLQRGDAVFVPADVAWTLAGTGHAVVAAVPSTTISSTVHPEL